MMGFLKIKRFFLCLWILMGALWAASPAYAGWDERISLFDPVGSLFNPLREAVPGLEVKGLVRNWTRLAIHEDTYDPNSRGFERTKRFPSIEWLGELKLRYQATPNLEIVNIDNFLYDSAFRWESGGSYSPTARRELEYYHTTDRILRELYAVYYYDDILDIKLGKQQLVWGKMDGKVIDIINPSDNRYSLTGTTDDYEWTRLPLWMANVVYTFGDYYLQMLWIPDFRPNRNAPLDGPFRSIARRPKPCKPSIKKPCVSTVNSLLSLDTPTHGFADNEWALKFNLAKGPWDVSLVYFYTWNYDAIRFRRGFEDTLEAGKEVRTLFLEPKHTRIHQFGLDTDRSFQLLGKNILLKGEAVYTLNSYFSINETEPGWKLGGPRPSRNDGAKKSNQFLGAVNLETKLRGELSLSTQVQLRHIFGYDGQIRSLGRPLQRNRLDVSFGANKLFKFTDNRLGLYWVNYYYATGSWRERFDAKYALSDYVDLMVRYWAFWGNRNSPYGMLNDRDELEFFLKYAF